MNRYRPGSETRNEPPRVEGDAALLGVIAKLSPEKIPEGYASAATNKIFASGAAETRAGILTPVCHRTGVSPLFGSGIYSDPSGVEYIVQVTANAVYLTRDGRNVQSVGVPTAVTAAVEVVQAFSVLLIFRGDSLAPWSWSGDMGDAFEEISQEDPGDGTTAIPNAVTAELMSNRLLVPNDRNNIAVSELLDYLRYDPTVNEFNVNSGSDDTIVRIFPFANNSLLVFKDQSISMISGIYGDLSSARLDQINREIGLVARKGVAMVGADVLFLATSGVYRVQQIIQDRIQTGSVPVSDPIEPLIRRISAGYHSTAVAAVLGRYFYLAVPIDGATRPNAILVYDTTSDAWQGIHTFPSGVAFDNLLISDWNGRKRLYAVDHTAARVHLMYEGRGDQVANTWYQISDSIDSRGYMLGDQGTKNFRRVTVMVTTWNPSMSLSLVLDGHNELKPLTPTPITKSRTRYYTQGTAAWDQSNANNDHANPKREDYSIDFSIAIAPGASGIDPDAKQSTIERRQTGARARWAAIRVSSTQGCCDVNGLEIEALSGSRTLHTQA